jgi:predicted sulfurtransferase
MSRSKCMLFLLVLAMLILGACQPIQAPAEMQAEVAPQPTPMVIESTNDVPLIALDEAKKHFDNDTAIFVDSRGEAEYDTKHIAGAIRLPIVTLDKFGDMLSDTLPKDKLIITYCT